MRWLSTGLSYLLFVQSVGLSAPGQAGGAAGGLNIIVVEGEGAINNVRQRTAREAIVQVEDENHKPVAGAAVVFTLPNQGATGVFANGSHTLAVTTDSQGRAAARGIRLNRTAGRMEMRVTASQGGRTASAIIVQSNVLGAAAAGAAAGLSGKMIALIVVAGAAVAGGIVAGTQLSGGNNNTATGAGRPPATITPGTGTVGPPR